MGPGAESSGFQLLDTSDLRPVCPEVAVQTPSRRNWHPVCICKVPNGNMQIKNRLICKDDTGAGETVLEDEAKFKSRLTTDFDV